MLAEIMGSELWEAPELISLKNWQRCCKQNLLNNNPSQFIHLEVLK